MGRNNPVSQSKHPHSMAQRFWGHVAHYYKTNHINSWIIFFVLVYVVFVIKLITLKSLSERSIWLSLYSFLVSGYILSRFALAYFYEPEKGRFNFNYEYEPTITFGVPAKNEGEKIYETVMRLVKSNYPVYKFDVVAINDGSTDQTLSELMRAKRAAAAMGVWVEVVDWKVNRGKRDGMAECARRSRHDIVIYIDSDSFLEPDAARELIKYFYDPKIGAVAGHAYVANADKNMLTKMQSVRYYVAFKAYKAAEAIFGAVTCCSGCCAAYRRTYLMEVLDEWQSQTFWGVRCTYGDDRSLTNAFLQKNYKAIFAPEAKSQTFVPDNLRQFLRQQLRWKKSWLRESFRAAGFMWKKHPVMSASFYLGVILPLLGPIVVFRALLWYPYTTGSPPYFYIIGLALMALLYGLYYYIHMQDSKWVFGVLFATVYTFLLIWQLPYAILTIRDSRWGTR